MGIVFVAHLIKTHSCKAYYSECRKGDNAAAENSRNNSEKYLKALSGAGFFLLRLCFGTLIAVKIPLIAVAVAIGVCAVVAVIAGCPSAVLGIKLCALFGFVFIRIFGIAPTGGGVCISFARSCGFLVLGSTVYFVFLVHI